MSDSPHCQSTSIEEKALLSPATYHLYSTVRNTGFINLLIEMLVLHMQVSKL